MEGEKGYRSINHSTKHLCSTNTAHNLVFQQSVVATRRQATFPLFAPAVHSIRCPSKFSEDESLAEFCTTHGSCISNPRSVCEGHGALDGEATRTTRTYTNYSCSANPVVYLSFLYTTEGCVFTRTLLELTWLEIERRNQRQYVQARIHTHGMENVYVGFPPSNFPVSLGLAVVDSMPTVAHRRTNGPDSI